LKKRIYRRFATWIKNYGIPLRVGKEKARIHYRSVLINKGMTSWISSILVRRKITEIAEVKNNRIKATIKEKVFNFWKTDLKVLIRKLKSLESKRKKFIKARLLARWKGELNMRKKMKYNMFRAAIAHNIRMAKKVFKHLNNIRKMRK
jgi:hypothetical protein